MSRTSSPRVQPGDPAARRRAIIAVVAATVAGVSLMAGQAWYREPVRAWLLDNPAETAARARLLLASAGAVLLTPLVAFAIYTWRLGARVIASREFPPRDYAVIRDTPIVTGDAAVAQGRGLKAIAIFLAVASLAITGVLWRLGALLTR